MPGAEPAQVVVIGSGNVGSAATRTAAALGATVTVLTRTEATAESYLADAPHGVRLAKAERIQAVLRSEQLTQPPPLTGAYALTVRAAVAVIVAFNTEIATLAGQVEAHFGRHPDAEIYRSQPGLGKILGARVLGEFGDDPDRYEGARARKNYAGNAPITRASGKKKIVLARFVRNHRLADALHQQAFCALNVSPGAGAYYDQLRARGAGHHAAPTQQPPRRTPARLLKTRTRYDEATAWSHHKQDQQAAA